MEKKSQIFIIRIDRMTVVNESPKAITVFSNHNPVTRIAFLSIVLAHSICRLKQFSNRVLLCKMQKESQTFHKSNWKKARNETSSIPQAKFDNLTVKIYFQFNHPIFSLVLWTATRKMCKHFQFIFFLFPKLLCNVNTNATRLRNGE